jgi:hypothetical protein
MSRSNKKLKGCSIVFLSVLITIQLMLVILKRSDVITSGWAMVLIPLWIYLGIGAITITAYGTLKLIR